MNDTNDMVIKQKCVHFNDDVEIIEYNAKDRIYQKPALYTIIIKYIIKCIKRNR